MWFLNRFDGDSAAYNVPVVIRLSGALDIGALRAAVADLVARHEVLRTTYPETPAGPVQVVLPVGEAVPDVSVLPTTDADVLGAVTRFCAAGFDVTAEVPIRVAVFQVAPTEFVLAVVVHHISGDGSSEGPLARDMMTAYVARAQGEAPGWPRCHCSMRTSPSGSARCSVTNRIRNRSPPSNCRSGGRPSRTYRNSSISPLDRARPTTQSFAGGQVPFAIAPSLHAALDRVARQHNATLFMVLHAALAVVLARLSNTDDVAVGTPVSGRHEAELDDLIGMFVNTVVFRTTLDRSETFSQLLFPLTPHPRVEAVTRYRAQHNAQYIRQLLNVEYGYAKVAAEVPRRRINAEGPWAERRPGWHAFSHCASIRTVRPAPPLPPHDKPAPVAAHQSEFVGEHQQSERDHPEAQDRQEA